LLIFIEILIYFLIALPVIALALYWATPWIFRVQCPYCRKNSLRYICATRQDTGMFVVRSYWRHYTCKICGRRFVKYLKEEIKEIDVEHEEYDFSQDLADRHKGKTNPLE
jgi:transcription elongation factor Elf1